MNKNKKLDHMLALTEEVNILTQRLKPQATGHIHTTINTLRERIDELKKELYDRPAMLGGEEIDGMYTDDEVKEWDVATSRHIETGEEDWTTRG